MRNRHRGKRGEGEKPDTGGKRGKKREEEEEKNFLLVPCRSSRRRLEKEKEERGGRGEREDDFHRSLVFSIICHSGIREEERRGKGGGYISSRRPREGEGEKRERGGRRRSPSFLV